MARPRRRVLIVAGGILGVLLLLIFALILFFPTDRVAAMATERASDALDREVTVGSVGLRLWPVPAVALERVHISGTRLSAAPQAPAAAAPLADIPRIEVRLRLLPLLRRAVEVHTIVIDRPVLSIRPEMADTATRPREGGGFWDEATFDIREIRVVGATLEYTDTSTSTRLRAAGLNQRLRLEGDVREGELAHLRLRGGVSVDSLTVDAPNALAFPIQGLRVAIEHDAALDMSAERADFEQLLLRIEEFAVDGSGSVSGWSDPAARRVSLRFESDDADLATLVASLPEAMRSWPRGAADDQQLSAAGGRVSVRATVDGPLGEGRVPAVDGLLVLEEVALARGREPLIAGLGGALTFSLDSISTSGLSATLLGEPLRAAFTLRDFEVLQLSGSVDGAVDLGRAAGLGLLPPGWTASGLLPVALAATGPLADTRAVAVDGHVGLAGVTLRGAEWPADLSVIAGELSLSNQEIVGRGLNGRFGQSDLTLEVAAAEWLPFALGDSLAEPRVAFEARSRFVDLDALFPTDPSEPTYAELFFARLAGNTVQGRTATDAAEEAGLRLPDIPRMLLEGRFRAERVTQRKGDYRDVDVRIAGRDRQLELRDVSFRTFGGAVQMAARLGSATDLGEGGRRAPVELSFEIDEVEAGSFLQRFTAFRDNLGGSLLLTGAMTMSLDEHLLPDPASVSASGTIGVLDGRITNWSLVRRFGEQLGIAGFDTLAFRDWSGSFTMLGSRIVLRESALEAEGVTINSAGWFDVGGALEIGATANLGPALTSRVRQGPAATLVAAAGDRDGRIPVGVRITGTRTDPTVRLDLSEAGSRVADRVRQEAEAEAREMARTAAEQLRDRVLGADSAGAPTTPGAAVEGAVQRAQETAVGRLRGLLGAPGGGASPPTPQTEAPPPAPAPPSADAGGAASDP